ncbi:condensation domain-containing protein, partial [Streptomyces sp. NPDC020141]|uniref:condensation domain-containing protein n=1 Tax=Streptomyces sp. NPDC020141 TaxID=3365065 RepID=UPI003790629A
LTTHPHITHATVHLRHDQPHHPHLTAYLVPTEGEECPGPGDLHAFLRSRLPAYMVPTAFVLVDAVPLTRNGKVDRLRLPAPAQEHRPSGAGAAPENGTERAIADIWRELFGTEGIGVEDDFFDLGGHSLIATRIVSRLRAAVDPAVSVRDLFEHRTVRALAAAVRAAEPSSGTGRVLPRAAGTGELSFAQRRLWFFDQLSPGSATYNVTVAWRVGGRIDPQVLARALREICERHEVLRTSFAESEGRPYPVVSPSAAFVLETEDLRGAEDEAVRRVQRLAVKPFDLNAGPLLRVQLFKVAEDRHRLALHLHHIVVDGWSMDVLWKELSALYDAYAAGLPSPLPPPAIQYADYAAWQNAWLESEPVREQLRYWTGALAGAPESPVLPSRPRPKVRSGRGRTHRFTVPAETAEALGAVGRAHGATPFMVFLTAFHVLLARYTGGSDIVTGSPVAGRVRPESEELIGFFVNAMALRLRWSGDPAFSELLARARATVLDAQRHQDIPFDRVVEELGPERDLSRNPVFQIFFAYNAADDHPTPAGWSVERADTDPGLARFDLELELEEGPEGVRGALCYSTDLFEPSTVRGLAEHFVTLCAGIAADPGRTVSGLPLLDETERDRILRVWNEQEERGEPRADEGHPLDRFEAVVRAAPDAVALDHLGEHLAYRELDVRANRLAHRIAEQGVGPEDVVAVCLGRGPDAITALLAVLKAGAAYLPLDPALPVRRLAHMLQDAGTRLVLTASAHTAALPAGDLPVLLVDGRASGRHPATPPDVPRDRDALAYVVYTSGTTGVPKGIAVTWRTLDHVIRFDGHRERTRGIAPRSCAQLASLSFDVSLQEVFVTLLRAGRLVLVGDEARRDPDRLLELLSEREVERVYLSPAQLDQLAVSWSERPSALAVRHVSAGGEALRLGPEAVELLSALPGVVLENQYGPSETHHATSALLTGDPGTWPT